MNQYITTGTLTLATTTGLTFNAGDGAADATMTFIGTQAAINAALNGLTFLPTSVGTVELRVDTQDNGLTGYGPGLTDSKTLTINVTSANQPPIIDGFMPAIGAPGPVHLVVQEGNSVNFALSAFDPEGNALRYVLDAKPEHATLSQSPGSVFASFAWAGMHTENRVGVHNVTVRVEEVGNLGNFDLATYSVTILPAPSAPSHGGPHLQIDNQTVPLEGRVMGTLVFRVEPSDLPMSEPLTFEFVGPEEGGHTPPAGIELDQVTGIVRWAPDESQDNQSHNVTIRVNYSGGSLTDPFTITVPELNLRPESYGPPGNHFDPSWGSTDQHGTLFVRTFFDEDDDFRPVSLQLSIPSDADDPQQTLIFELPESSSGFFEPAITSSGLFTWNVRAEEGVATHLVKVRVRDTGPSPVSRDIELRVNVSDWRQTPSHAAVALPLHMAGRHIAPFQQQFPGASAGSPTSTPPTPDDGEFEFDFPTETATFTPDNTAQAPGLVTVRYTLHFDGTADSNSAPIEIHVHNDRPTAFDTSTFTPYSTDEGVTLNVNLASELPLLADYVSLDSDEDPLRYSLQEQAAHGTVTINATTGEFDYVPETGFHGTDSFVFKLSDVTVAGGTNEFEFYPSDWFDTGFHTNRQLYGLVHIIVVDTGPSNSAPTAVNDPATGAYTVLNTDELNIAAPGVLANDTDPEGDDLTAVLEPSEGPDHASFFELRADGSFRYVPVSTYVGSDSFKYRAQDEHGAFSNLATVSIDVQAPPSNEPPQANPDGIYELPPGPSNSVQIAKSDVLFNDTDDGQIAPLTAVLVSGNSQFGGTVTQSGGFFIYTAPPGFVGFDWFDYKAFDGALYSDPTTVTIEVVVPYGEPLNPPDSPINPEGDCGCGDYQPQPNGQTGAHNGNLATGNPGAPMVRHNGGANPHPTFVLESQLLPGPTGANYPVPSAVRTQVSITTAGGQTINGQTVYYNNTGTTVGEQLRFVTTMDATPLDSGSYLYNLTIVNTYGSREVAQTFTRRVNIVNRTNSEFGNRWSLVGLDRLHVQSGVNGNGVLLAQGAGNTFWFENAAGAYQRPLGEPGFSQLTINGSGQYELRSRYGDVSTFNSSSGLLLSRADRNGNVTTYQYFPGTDDIRFITDPWNRTTEFIYSGGRVHKIRDFAGRETVFGYDAVAGTLTSVTKPDPDPSDGIAAPVNVFTYNSTTKLMETWTSATNGLYQFSYDAAGRLHTMIENGHVSTLRSVQSVGWIDYTLAGNPGTVGNPAPIPDRSVLVQDHGQRTDAHGVTTQFMVDRFGYKTNVRDEIGNNFTHGRNDDGLPFDVFLPDPNVIGGASAALRAQSTFDGNGNIRSMTLPDGSQRHWEYDSTFNQVTRYTDELGRVTLYELDSFGNVHKMIQVVGAIDSLSSETDDLTWVYEHTTASDFVPRGMLKTVTDPLSTPANPRRTRYTYINSPSDEARHGQLQSISYADGVPGLTATEFFGYDEFGNVNSFQDEELRVTNYEFDDLDRLVKTTLPAIEVGGVRPVLEYEYDKANRLTKQRDGEGNTTEYVYCGCGRLQEVIEENPTTRSQNPRPTTQYLYEPNGRLMAIIEPAAADGLERRTDYGYDALDRLSTVTLPDPDGPGPNLPRPVYVTTYGAQGHVLTELDAENNLTSYQYDNRGRAKHVTLPNVPGGSPVYQTDYDSAGQVIQETDPLGRVTRYHYDTLGRLVRTHNPVTGTTSFAYDKNSNLTSQIDAANRVTTFEYDARDRQTKIIDPRQGETRFEYDKVNNLKKLTDPVSNVTTFVYNTWNQLKQEQNTLEQGQPTLGRFYAYEPLTGNLARVTDRNGRVTEFDYDNQHRLTTESWRDFAGGPIVRTITSVYDNADQFTSITDTAGGQTISAYSYQYDTLGRAKTISNAGTFGSPTVVLTQQFDEHSRRTGLSATIDMGLGAVADFVNIYGYDGLSRMTQVTQTGQGGNAVAAKRVDFQYNKLGQFTGIQRYADLAGFLGVASSGYTYETGTQRLTGLQHLGTSSVVANYTWSYDTLGRVKSFRSLNDSDNTASYFYDATDQLVAVLNNNLPGDDRNFGYDLNGNRTDSEFDTPVGNNNRLVSDGTFEYEYDGEGNLTERTRISNDLADDYKTLYKWDHRNRLIEVEFKNNGGTTKKRVAYTYDVYDRRIGKKVDTDGLNGFDRSERFVFDANRDLLFVFLDANGDAGGLNHSLTHRHLNGAMVDQVLAEEVIDGTPGEISDVYWFLADNLGSNREVVRRVGSSTVSVEHLRFDAFGEILLDDNPDYAQRQSYAGLEFDADVGLYYAWHRWYDPATHRFLSEDPIAYDRRNLARYVRNNPANRSDPSGLEPNLPSPDNPMDVDDFYREILGGKVMDDPYIIYREGCQGLFKLRIGPQDVGTRGAPNKRFQIVPKGVRCFDTLQAALHYARQLVEDGQLPHVYAVQSGSPFRPLSGNRDGELNPHSFVPNDPNFASRIMQNGEPLWEWINHGWTKGREGDEKVKRERCLPTHRSRLYTAYCVARTRDLRVTPPGMGPEAGPDFDRRNRQPY